MSREVRRVPVGWRHPAEPNPHWMIQASFASRMNYPPSQLHGPTEQFVALQTPSVSVARATWDAEREQWDAGVHEHLRWLLKYHSADGYDGRSGYQVHPYEVYDEAEENVIRSFHPTSTAEIVAVYPYEEYAGDRPTTATHMPDFDVPPNELGWCLYQTVSEGTPVTPVFATATELVQHLATVGEDEDQVPYRREAAEALVGRGSSCGTFVTTGGRLFDSAKDADLLDTAMGDQS